MLRGRGIVDVLAVRVKLGRRVVVDAESEVDDVEARRRLRARSLASSSFSRGVRVVFALAPPLALSRCWEVFDAAVMESRSLWNLRFEVAIASGMAAKRVSCIACVMSRDESLEARGSTR
jgi:hypothetical protein